MCGGRRPFVQRFRQKPSQTWGLQAGRWNGWRASGSAALWWLRWTVLSIAAVEIVAKAEGTKGFTPLPVRRRVEATFGSLTNFPRRLVRNWEPSLPAAANSLWGANARRTLRAATRSS